MNKNSKNCDLCQSKLLIDIYSPIESYKKSKVFLCRKCGLTHSYFKIKSRNLKKNVTYGAAWGNIRYGKSFISTNTINILKKNLNLNNINDCLDIGSNRGSFINQLGSINKKIRFIGVESDKRLKPDFKKYLRVKNFKTRFEKFDFSRKFDLIHCSHTLEHLDSPSLFFKKIKNFMYDKTILYLEVPNLKVLKHYSNFVEEFFIDKHSYHFSEIDLSNYENKYGLKLIKKFNNKHNLIHLLKLNKNFIKKKNLKSTYLQNFSIIKNYKRDISINLKNLDVFFKKILPIIKSKKIVLFWGAGRIFSALYQRTNLKLFNKNIYLVDKNLSNFIKKINNLKIYKPQEIKKVLPYLVVITARSFESEIKNEIYKYYNKNTKIISLLKNMNSSKKFKYVN